MLTKEILDFLIKLKYNDKYILAVFAHNNGHFEGEGRFYGFLSIIQDESFNSIQTRYKEMLKLYKSELPDALKYFIKDMKEKMVRNIKARKMGLEEEKISKQDKKYYLEIIKLYDGFGTTELVADAMLTNYSEMSRNIISKYIIKKESQKEYIKNNSSFYNLIRVLDRANKKYSNEIQLKKYAEFKGVNVSAIRDFYKENYKLCKKEMRLSTFKDMYGEGYIPKKRRKNTPKCFAIDEFKTKRYRNKNKEKTNKFIYKNINNEKYIDKINEEIKYGIDYLIIKKINEEIKKSKIDKE